MIPDEEDLGTSLRRAALGDLAALARKHRVMISITFTPYDEDDDGDLEVEALAVEGSAR